MTLPAFLAAMPRAWWGAILGGGFLVFWLWLSSGYLRAFRRFRTWPSVSGRLISAGPEKVYRNWQDDFVARVRYEYRVGAQVYEGRVVESVHLYVPPTEPVGWHKRESVDRYIAQLHRDGNVTVYYNPADPSQAFLRHSSRGPIYFGWAVAMLFLVRGCVLPWFK